ncbi:hypothetical protein B0I35DRAFT_166825 [Stachybotrys elegans]|uniref:Uncharacterized protein n=1 Tax=Stachybotrys elegans TaxID=80388 RepID=A0A8K0WUE6_9HYPO|nr:hypothetical protein B0I35DRAFT_166825 [Stachybotrys elegans]
MCKERARKKKSLFTDRLPDKEPRHGLPTPRGKPSTGINRGQGVALGGIVQLGEACIVLVPIPIACLERDTPVMSLSLPFPVLVPKVKLGPTPQCLDGFFFFSLLALASLHPVSPCLLFFFFFLLWFPSSFFWPSVLQVQCRSLVHCGNRDKNVPRSGVPSIFLLTVSRCGRELNEHVVGYRDS